MSNLWNEYLDYTRDNPKGYWFKRKIIGFGWTPVTWQGWLVTLLFVGFVIVSGMQLGANVQEPSEKEFRAFFVRVGAAVILLLAICYKTGEKPKWQWWFPKKDSKSESR